MLQHDVKWEKKGIHEKHFSVLNFGKTERAKEVAKLEKVIFSGKEELSDILHQKIMLGQKTEQIRKEGEAIRKKVNKMVQSKEVMERNIHAYDEDVKWQLPKPGTLMSAKVYRDKKAIPLVEKMKEVVNNLTIKCIQLAEQGRQLIVKVDGQKKQISRLIDKVMEQSDTID